VFIYEQPKTFLKTYKKGQVPPKFSLLDPEPNSKLVWEVFREKKVATCYNDTVITLS
jgi:hypothetical protein